MELTRYYPFKVVDFGTVRSSYYFKVAHFNRSKGYDFLFIPITQYGAYLMLDYLLGKRVSFPASLFSKVAEAVKEEGREGDQIIVLTDAEIITPKDVSLVEQVYVSRDVLRHLHDLEQEQLATRIKDKRLYIDVDRHALREIRKKLKVNGQEQGFRDFLKELCVINGASGERVCQRNLNILLRGEGERDNVKDLLLSFGSEGLREYVHALSIFAGQGGLRDYISQAYYDATRVLSVRDDVFNAWVLNNLSSGERVIESVLGIIRDKLKSVREIVKYGDIIFKLDEFLRFIEKDFWVIENIIFAEKDLVRIGFQDFTRMIGRLKARQYPATTHFDLLWVDKDVRKPAIVVYNSDIWSVKEVRRDTFLKKVGRAERVIESPFNFFRLSESVRDVTWPATLDTKFSCYTRDIVNDMSLFDVLGSVRDNSWSLGIKTEVSSLRDIISYFAVERVGGSKRDIYSDLALPRLREGTRNYVKLMSIPVIGSGVRDYVSVLHLVNLGSYNRYHVSGADLFLLKEFLRTFVKGLVVGNLKHVSRISVKGALFHQLKLEGKRPDKFLQVSRLGNFVRNNSSRALLDKLWRADRKLEHGLVKVVLQDYERHKFRDAFIYEFFNRLKPGTKLPENNIWEGYLLDDLMFGYISEREIDVLADLLLAGREDRPSFINDVMEGSIYRDLSAVINEDYLLAARKKIDGLLDTGHLISHKVNEGAEIITFSYMGLKESGQAKISEQDYIGDELVRELGVEDGLVSSSEDRRGQVSREYSSAVRYDGEGMLGEDGKPASGFNQREGAVESEEISAISHREELASIDDEISLGYINASESDFVNDFEAIIQRRKEAVRLEESLGGEKRKEDIGLIDGKDVLAEKIVEPKFGVGVEPELVGAVELRDVEKEDELVGVIKPVEMYVLKEHEVGEKEDKDSCFEVEVEGYKYHDAVVEEEVVSVQEKDSSMEEELVGYNEKISEILDDVLGTNVKQGDLLKDYLLKKVAKDSSLERSILSLKEGKQGTKDDEEEFGEKHRKGSELSEESFEALKEVYAYLVTGFILSNSAGKSSEFLKDLLLLSPSEYDSILLEQLFFNKDVKGAISEEFLEGVKKRINVLVDTGIISQLETKESDILVIDLEGSLDNERVSFVRDEEKLAKRVVDWDAGLEDGQVTGELEFLREAQSADDSVISERVQDRKGATEELTAGETVKPRQSEILDEEVVSVRDEGSGAYAVDTTMLAGREERGGYIDSKKEFALIEERGGEGSSEVKCGEREEKDAKSLDGLEGYKESEAYVNDLTEARQEKFVSKEDMLIGMNEKEGRLEEEVMALNEKEEAVLRDGLSAYLEKDTDIANDVLARLEDRKADVEDELTYGIKKKEEATYQEELAYASGESRDGVLFEGKEGFKYLEGGSEEDYIALVEERKGEVGEEYLAKGKERSGIEIEQTFEVSKDRKDGEYGNELKADLQERSTELGESLAGDGYKLGESVQDLIGRDVERASQLGEDVSAVKEKMLSLIEGFIFGSTPAHRAKCLEQLYGMAPGRLTSLMEKYYLDKVNRDFIIGKDVSYSLVSLEGEGVDTEEYAEKECRDSEAEGSVVAIEEKFPGMVMYENWGSLQEELGYVELDMLADKEKEALLGKGELAQGLLYDYNKDLIDQGNDPEFWSGGFGVPEDYDPYDPFNVYHPWSKTLTPLELVQREKWAKLGTGEWEIDKNNGEVYVSVEGDGGIYLDRFDSDSYRFTVDFTVKGGKDKGVGIIFKVTDENNYYKFIMHGGDLDRSLKMYEPMQLYKVENGVAKMMGAPMQPFHWRKGQRHTFEVTVMGDRIIIKVDGRTQYEFVES